MGACKTVSREVLEGHVPTQLKKVSVDGIRGDSEEHPPRDYFKQNGRIEVTEILTDQGKWQEEGLCLGNL